MSIDSVMNNIKSRREVKDITLGNYRRNLLKMHYDLKKMKEDEKYDVCQRCKPNDVKEGCKDFKNIDFLNDFENMKSYMDKLTPSVRKLRCSTILVALEDEDLINKYREYLFDEKVKYDKKMSENKKSAQQEKNWTSFKDLVKIHKNYREEVKHNGMLKKGKQVLDNRQKDLLTKFLISGLYTLIEPGRNDYTNMKVIDYKKYYDLDENDKADNRYLVIGTRKKPTMFHLGKNTYKTGKSTGVNHTMSAGRQLASVINVWHHYNKDAGYLLTCQRGKCKGKPMSSNSLTKYLYQTFKPTGKNIASNMIRHIYVSDNEKTKAVKEAEEIAKNMKHSLSQQQTTYLKK